MDEAARLYHTHQFACCFRGILKVLKDLLRGRRIEGVITKGKRSEIRDDIDSGECEHIDIRAILPQYFRTRSRVEDLLAFRESPNEFFGGESREESGSYDVEERVVETRPLFKIVFECITVIHGLW